MKNFFASIVGIVLPFFSFSQTYCSAGATALGPHIQNVVFSGISTGQGNPSCPSSAGYNDLTASQTATVARGSSYPITVNCRTQCEPTASNPKKFAIYIDWNDDGDFLDAGEFISESASFTGNNSFTAGNVTVPDIAIPLTAKVGNTRMRIVLQDSPSGTPSSCGTFPQGEVEDFSVVIQCGTGGPSGIITSREFDYCSDLAETFTASGSLAGVTLNWQTSANGTTWTNVSSANPYNSPAVTQTTYYRLTANDGSCNGVVGSGYTKTYFATTATPATICSGTTSQLNAPQFTTPQAYANNTAVPIPDQNTTGGSSSITVSNTLPVEVLNGTIQKVCMNISHAYCEDLVITLSGPDGTVLTLFNKTVGARVNFTNTCFVPGATTPIASGTSPYSGNFKPAGGDLYTAFANKPTNGVWTLKAVDNAFGDAGTIDNWTIVFNNSSIVWSPSITLSNASIKNPIASPSSTTTYTATITAPGSSCTYNDDITVTVQPLYSPDVTGSSTICSGNSTTLTATTTEAGCTFNWYSASSGGTLLKSNSATYSVSPVSTTTYFVDATYNGCTGSRTPYTVTVTQTPATPTGSDLEVCSGQSPELNASSTTSGAVLDWYDALSGGTKLGSGSPFNAPAITTNTTYYVESLKDGCPSSRKAINATVNPLPDAPTVENQSVCSGNTATFTATAPGGTYDWYSVATGGTPLSTGDEYTTPTLTNNTQSPEDQIYYVTATDAKGCVSNPRTEVIVTVKSIPTAPTVTSPVYTCEKSAKDLMVEAVPGDQVDWWASSTGEDVFVIDNSFYTTTELIEDTTVYVSSLRDGCYSSSRVPIDVIVIFRPMLDEASAVAICSGFSVDQQLTSTTDLNTVDVFWNSQLISGDVLGNSTDPYGTGDIVTDVLENLSTDPGELIYYARAATRDAEQCQGNEIAFNVTVNPLPAPVVADNAAICDNNSTTLLATEPGNDYNWYDVPTDGVPLNDVPSDVFITPILSSDAGAAKTYTYYVDNTDFNGCVSLPRTEVMVTVFPIPEAPTVENTTICEGSETTLQITSTGGSFQWYDMPGGSLVNTEQEFITSPTITTSYFVETTTDGCTGPQAEVVVTVIPTPAIDDLESQTFCSNSEINQQLSGIPTGDISFRWSANLIAGSATGFSSSDNSEDGFIPDVITNTGTDIAVIEYTIESVTLVNPGCPSPAKTFLISVNPEFEVLATVNNVICHGLATGVITITAPDAVQPTSFLWDSSTESDQTSAEADSLPTGNYQVTIFDAEGCKVIRSYFIDESPEISIDGFVENVSCNGGSNGSVVTSFTNAVEPIQFAWSDGSVNQDLISAPAGDYTLSIEDNNGCKKSMDFTLTEPEALMAIPNIVPVACYGDETGKISTEISGGVAPYSYSWNTGSTDTEIDNQPAGAYELLVTDANNCELNANFNIEQPTAPLSVSAISTNINCFGEFTGALDITAIGGTLPYSYTWGDEITSEDRNNLAAGVYDLLVTDQNNCITSGSYTLTETDPIEAELLVKKYAGDYNVSCFEYHNGEIDLTPTGGTAPYTYLWSTGQSQEDLVNLGAGNYQVMVSDVNNCTQTFNATLIEPVMLQHEVVDKTYIGGLNISCFGLSDGEINCTAQGGVAPYTYYLNNVITSFPATNLASDLYQIQVIDANGCEVYLLDTLYQPEPISLNSAVSNYPGGVNISCYGLTDGSITLSPTGGTQGYSYTWTNGSTEKDLTNLTVGNYSVTLTDANGCKADESFDLTQPASLNLNLTATTYNGGVNISCNGYSDGAISSTISGGVAPYSYLWSNNATSANINGLTANSYELTVTDKNGCKNTAATSLTQPTLLAHAFTTSSYNGYEVRCFNGNDGSVQSIPSGGTQPYSYLWGGGEITASLSNRSAGSQSILITDANGCLLTDAILLKSPTELGGNLDVSYFNGFNISCAGLADGTIAVIPSGGLTPYSYSWSAGLQPQANQSNLGAGSYLVTISDANSCTRVLNATLNQPQPISSAVVQTGFIPCNGDLKGAFSSTTQGGVSPYQYYWVNAENDTISTAQNPTSLGANAYKLVVVDLNGCKLIQNGHTISQPTRLVVTAQGVDLRCFNDQTGSVMAQASGATPGYTFKWLSGGPANAGWSNLPVGTYTVEVTDANQCKKTATVSIGEPSLLEIITIDQHLISCDGLPQGFVNTQARGGTPQYQYSWSNGGASASINNLLAGNYILTLTDNNDCKATQSYTITGIDTPDPGFTLLADPACGDLNALIQVNQVIPGTSFSILTGPAGVSTSDDLNFVLSATDYGKVTVKRTMNLSGCTATHQETVLFKDIPQPMFNGESDGELDILNNRMQFANNSVVSQLSPVSYLWMINNVPFSSDYSTGYHFPDSAEATYGICLKATNGFGCSDSICEPITVKGRNLVFIPNSFTPDGDGLNDVYEINAQGLEINSFRFAVFNRFGQEVFATTSPTFKWNGTFNNQDLPEGVYIYELSYSSKYLTKSVNDSGVMQIFR